QQQQVGKRQGRQHIEDEQGDVQSRDRALRARLFRLGGLLFRLGFDLLGGASRVLGVGGRRRGGGPPLGLFGPVQGAGVGLFCHELLVRSSVRRDGMS